MIATNEELEALCKEYQRLLRMQDWRVKVAFVAAGEMPAAGLQGYSDASDHSLDANILIICAKDFPKAKAVNEYDPEQILVHELLHCKFHCVDKEDSPAFEYAIDSTADCIVALRRATQP